MDADRQLVAHSWEGVFATEFTLAHVRQRCAAFAEMLISQQWSCLVAYDTRFMSRLFAQDIGHHLLPHGITTTLASAPVPLPAIQFALAEQYADCALVVSARNQPYWYNGLVVLTLAGTSPLLHLAADWSAMNQPGVAPPIPHDSLPFPPPIDLTYDTQLSVRDLRHPYLERLRSLVDVNLIRRATLTIFVDPMNGTTAGYIPAVIGEDTQTMAIEINREMDPLFGKTTPSPTVSELTRLRKLVRESDSHVGVAFSADGTTLAVVDKNGEQLSQIETVLLLAAYLARHYRHNGVVIIPPPPPGSAIASLIDGLPRWEHSVGIRVEMTDHATVHLVERLRRSPPDVLIGCTEEGELVLGNYDSYPDAVLAGLLLIELVARNGGNLRAPLHELRARLSGSG